MIYLATFTINEPNLNKFTSRMDATVDGSQTLHQL